MADGQRSAPLAPTRSDDRATGTGTHAQPETVGLGATPIVRLVRTLAHCLTPGAFRKYNDDEPADRAGGPCVPAAVAGTLSWNIARSGRSAVNRVVRVTDWCPVSWHQRTDGYRRKHKEDTG
ncbi:hypothetical protein GCM10022630_37570 [Thermobifida alba]